MLLARMRGCHSASEIANFYNQQNIVLQFLIPRMPSPEHKISANTINNIRALISEYEIENFFMEFLGLMSLALESLITFNDEKYKENREGTRETYSFDVQEMRASFKRSSWQNYFTILLNKIKMRRLCSSRVMLSSCPFPYCLNTTKLHYIIFCLEN